MTIRLLENGGYRLLQNLDVVLLEESGRLLENGFLRLHQDLATRTFEGACTEASFWTCCPGVAPNCALVLCGLAVSSSVGLVSITVYATAAICCGNLIALGRNQPCTAYFSFYITDVNNNVVWQIPTCAAVNIGGQPLGTIPCGVAYKAITTQTFSRLSGTLTPGVTYKLHAQLWNGSPCNQGSFVTDVSKQFVCGF